MKILIIGSEGFIGSNLKKYFSKKHHVYSADIIENYFDSYYFQLSKVNTDYKSLFENNQFDVCINASGNGSVPISIQNPTFDFNLNVTNTIKILDAIRLFNPSCKFLSLSSAAVYGNPKKLPVNESDEINPLSPYGWHKFYAENLCLEYNKLYNLKTINLRLFSVYGEGLKKQLFWDLFQKCIKSKGEVSLFGSGNETRDFIYIDDLVNAVELIILNGIFDGNSINVASGEENTIKKAAQYFINQHNPNIKIKFNKKVKIGDPLYWKADISLLKSYGYKPLFSLEKGMKRVVKWMQENK